MYLVSRFHCTPQEKKRKKKVVFRGMNEKKVFSGWGETFATTRTSTILGVCNQAVEKPLHRLAIGIRWSSTDLDVIVLAKSLIHEMT